MDDSEIESLANKLASDLTDLKAENGRLASRVKSLEQENRHLESLDEIATERDRSYCQQIRSLQAQVEVLKEVLEMALSR